MYTCCARGPTQSGLIPESMSDATRFAKVFPDVPCLGFYANGEFGPMALAGNENVFQSGRSAHQGVSRGEPYLLSETILNITFSQIIIASLLYTSARLFLLYLSFLSKMDLFSTTWTTLLKTSRNSFEPNCIQETTPAQMT